AGLRPGDDVPIVYSGLRPGEKLSEDLLFGDETRLATVADGVWSVDMGSSIFDPFGGRLDELLSLARSGGDHGVPAMLMQLGPEYPPAELMADYEDIPTEREALADVLSIAAGE